MTTTMLGVLMLSCLLSLGGGLLLLPRLREDERMRSRLKQVQLDTAPTGVAPTVPRSPLVRFVAGVGARLGRTSLGKGKTGDDMRATLAQAGFRGEHAFSLFLGSKALLTVGLPLGAYLLLPSDMSPAKHHFIIIVAAVIGLLGPEKFIKGRRKRYLNALQNGMSDALDLMVICVESGLGLEPALERVSQEIGVAHGPVAIELDLTVTEMRIVADRRLALMNMGLRTGLDQLKRFGSTLAQTLQYGTPLADALRILSAEMRTETMTRFEAKAARLPVMLTVPMILFILPCLFLVVGGPALVQVLAIWQ